MSRPRGRTVAAALAVAALWAAGGCGRSETGTAAVTGRVLFQGRPLPGGVVRFHSARDDRAASAPIQRDGTYALAAAPVGKVKICVDTAHLRRQFDWNLPVPEKYRTFKTTDLTYTVRPGSQTYDVLLE